MKKLIAIAILIIASVTTAQVNGQVTPKGSYNLDVIKNIVKDSLSSRFGRTMIESESHTQQAIDYVAGKGDATVSNFTRFKLDDLKIENVSPQSIANGLLGVISEESQLDYLDPDLFNVTYVQYKNSNYVIVTLENSKKLTADDLNKQIQERMDGLGSN